MTAFECGVCILVGIIICLAITAIREEQIKNRYHRYAVDMNYWNGYRDGQEDAYQTTMDYLNKLIEIKEKEEEDGDSGNAMGD